MLSNSRKFSIGGTAPDLADDFAFAVCLLVQESDVSRQVAKSTQSQEASLFSSKPCLLLISARTECKISCSCLLDKLCG